MIHLVVRHKDQSKAQTIAQAIVDDLLAHSDKANVDVMGPYESTVKMVRDLYRVSIMIRGRDLDPIKAYIEESWIYKQEDLIIDVDPQ